MNIKGFKLKDDVILRRCYLPLYGDGWIVYHPFGKGNELKFMYLDTGIEFIKSMFIAQKNYEVTVKRFHNDIRGNLTIAVILGDSVKRSCWIHWDRITSLFGLDLSWIG